MRTETFLLKLLPVKPLSFLAVALALLITGCSSNPGPGGGAAKVSFNTEDGIQLSGYLFGEGDVGVVLSHMRPADQESWWPFARVLKDKGYQVLTYDFRGYRDSQGELDIDNIDKDVQAALDFLKSKGVSKIFLMGASMGGTASLKVASREDVAGVITLSAPPVIEGLDAREDVRVISAPKLFIAAREDLGYARSVDVFDQTAPEPKERQIVDGNAHGTDMLSGDSGPRVQGLIADFLRRYSE
jgi:pimeloyl-ACP methyl ester carboxylesterase